GAEGKDSNAKIKVIAFGEDGWVAAASQREIGVWNVKTLELIGSKEIRAESIAFSLDGRYVALANREPMAQVFETTKWSEVAQLFVSQQGYSEGAHVMGVSFSPDSRWLAVGAASEKNCLTLWNVADFGKGIDPARKPMLSVNADITASVAFSPK